MRYLLLGCLLSTAVFGQNPDASAKAAEAKSQLEPSESLTTASGLRFGLWPKRPAKPSPVLFVLANGQAETLGSKYFRQSGNFLVKDGVICVSVDLPCHGLDAKPTEKGLTGWRTRCDNGKDFVADFNAKLTEVLDHLIKEGIADPERIAALGTSRGGFMAIHFAIADPRVKSVIAFAPVTDLAKINEFKGGEELPVVKSLALEKHAGALAGRSLWMVIGDRDDRVSTDSLIHFARAVSQTTLAKGNPAAVDFHVVAEPRGHSVPAGYAEMAAGWLRNNFALQPAQ